jgi:hypothetical protein
MDFTLKYPFHFVFFFPFYFFGFWSNLRSSFDGILLIGFQKRGVEYVVDSLSALEFKSISAFANFGKYAKWSIKLGC